MRDIDRRRFLELTGAAGAAGLAGCTGLGGDGNGSPDDSGTPNEDGSGTPGNNPEQTAGSGSAVLETPDSPFSFFASTDTVGFPTEHFEENVRDQGSEDAYIMYIFDDLGQLRSRGQEIGEAGFIDDREETITTFFMPGLAHIGVSADSIDSITSVGGKIGYDVFTGLDIGPVEEGLLDNGFEEADTYNGFNTFEGGELPDQRGVWPDTDYSRIVGTTDGGILQALVPPNMSLEEGRSRYRSLVDLLEGEGQSLADEREDVQKMKDWYGDGYSASLLIDQEGVSADEISLFTTDQVTMQELETDNLASRTFSVYGNGTTRTQSANTSYDEFTD